MKIAIDAFEGNLPERTGPGNYVYRLVEALAACDSENSYEIFLRKPASAEFQSLGANFNIRPLWSPLNRTFWSQLRLPPALREAGCDLVHIPGHRAPLSKIGKAVVTIFDLAYLKYGEYFRPAHRMRLKYFTERSIEKASRIIAISEATKADIIEHYKVSPDKIDVTHLGVDPDFCPVEDLFRLEKTKMYYGICKKYLLYVGTLQPRKNLARLARVFKRVNEATGNNYQLVIAGKSGWMCEEIFKGINEAGDTLALDYVPKDDLVALLSGAELFVFPSLYEGFGLPILEAMACGVPVAASNVSSLPEVGGNAAVYFNPESEDNMFEAILRALSDGRLRKSLSERGVERVKQFTWGMTARKTIEAYNKVAQGVGSPLIKGGGGCDRGTK